MKNIFKFTYLALVGMIAMTVASCSDSYKYDGRGEWDATDGYANIYFAITDSVLELDPADPTTVNVTVVRRNTQGALTVPFEIQKNTDDVFTVTDAVFADGQAETEITLSFPNAEIGKPYTLEITSSDPSVVSQYSAGAIYTIEVTRVKWNDVGFYYEETADGKKEKVEGWAMYTDDFISSIFPAAEAIPYAVKLQERDDVKGVFRIINAYGEAFPYNDPGDWDESKDYYIIINATDPEKVYISPSDLDLGVDWGYGKIHAINYAGDFVEEAEAAEAAGDNEAATKYLKNAEKYYGKYENGKITFPKEAFFVLMENYENGERGWRSSGVFTLVINPDLSPYNADMSSKDDFEWEEVYAGNFTSEQMGTQKEGVKLYKGTCINTTDECDARFAKEYGTAYMIESPYTEGYNLYFAVNEKGEVTLPEDLKYQSTGIKIGSEVFAVISPAASTFTENLVTLKIAFQTKPDANGSYTEFGSAEEVLSNITWTKVGTGTYTYTSFFADYDEETDEDIPYADGPLDIYQRDDQPTIYKVTDWGYGADFIFTWDGKDKVTVPVSFTGYTSPYGDVYVSDIPTYDNKYNYAQFPNTYDTDSQTFSFNVAYWCEQGLFANSIETLEVKWGASATSRAATTKKHLSINKAKTRLANKKQHSWFGKGKKANAKNKRALNAISGTPLFVR